MPFVRVVPLYVTAKLSRVVGSWALALYVSEFVYVTSRSAATKAEALIVSVPEYVIV